MKNTAKWIAYGVLTWLVPFIISFGFYDQQGNLQTSYDLFKSSMIVISSVVGCYVLYLFFKSINNEFVKWGLLFGVFLLVFNWTLDVFILVPFAEMEYDFYFESIGLRYLQIPIFSACIGWILSHQNK
ncbi:MAG: hypothetical protein RLN86_10805 [Cyclobacteriaceae bacterium]